MTIDNTHDTIKTESKSIHSKPLSIKNFPSSHRDQQAPNDTRSRDFSKDSASMFNMDDDSISQYSVDGYHGDINEDTIEKSHTRGIKKSFFERIGLKKKPQSLYSTEYEEEAEVQSNFSISSPDDDEEEEDEEDDEDSPPQINTASTTPSAILPQPYDSNGQYIKTKIKHKKFDQEFARLMLAQTIYTNERPGHTLAPSDTMTEPSPNYPYGALWVIRFTKDGRYLATAGQSCTVFLWKLLVEEQQSIKVLDETPYMEYKGHTADVLDLAWSKNNFLLSSSMDNTVRLWHTTQKECLCVFQHTNLVTAVDFHPKDDRFFLSGSMDGRIRIWSIPEKRVAFWNEIPNGKCATAAAFTLDGKTVIAGSHDGHCYFFETQGLKYNTQISVMNDTSSNRNSSSKKGPKITGIEVMPGLPPGEEKILITSNDSRVRLYNMKDKSLMFKYKGVENNSLQIKATFSDDGRYVISGSENCHAYIWRTEQSSVMSPLHQLQETRNKAMSALGHVGESTLSLHSTFENSSLQSTSTQQQQTRISKWLKRRGDDTSNKIRSRTEYFEAHDHIVTAAVFAPTKTRQHIARSKQDIIFNNTPVNLRRMSTATTSSGGSVSSSFYNNNTTYTEDEVYPTGHIIVTADYRGLIKVWRIDSGAYNTASPDNHTQSLLHVSESSLHTNSSASIKSAPASPKVRRNFGLFRHSK